MNWYAPIAAIMTGTEIDCTAHVVELLLEQ